MIHTAKTVLLLLGAFIRVSVTAIPGLLVLIILTPKEISAHPLFRCLSPAHNMQVHRVSKKPETIRRSSIMYGLIMIP